MSFRPRSITLRTDKDRWIRKTNVEDPVFSDLFNSMMEVGELPQVITLTSTVGQIVEEEWPHYERLIKWMTYVSEMERQDKDGKYVVQYETKKMRTLLEASNL